MGSACVFQKPAAELQAFLPFLNLAFCLNLREMCRKVRAHNQDTGDKEQEWSSYNEAEGMTGEQE